MTAQELFDFLEQVVHDGKGDLPVYFDTEAREFNYHLAKIGSAYCLDKYREGITCICLHEENE